MARDTCSVEFAKRNITYSIYNVNFIFLSIVRKVKRIKAILLINKIANLYARKRNSIKTYELRVRIYNNNFITYLSCQSLILQYYYV